MNLEIKFFGKNSLAVRARELASAQMNHFDVFVEVTFLRKMHVAMGAGVGLLTRVGPQVVEVLAHRKDGEGTLTMLALE